MNVQIVPWIVALCLGWWGAESARAADTAYAADTLATSRQVVRFPVGSPASLTIVGPQADLIAGMDFSPNGQTLWAVNATTQFLGTLSLSTGSFTPSVAIAGGCCTSAFTIDPVSGAILVSRGDHLVYQLDPNDGTRFVLGAGVPVGQSITALAMSCSGVVVAAHTNAGNSDLYRTDLLTTPVLIGTSTFGVATTLEFDNPTGQLYGWFNGAGQDVSTHGAVNMANAQLSGTGLFAGRYRMAIDNACSIDQVRVFGNGFEG